MNTQLKKLNILLADDDIDDRYFFAKALADLPIHTFLETVEDGELLIAYLKEKSDDLPDVLFLDLNMPKKNGAECLSIIKGDKALRKLPVVIYSTSLHSAIADILYKKGACYYIRKTEFSELKKILRKVLPTFLENRPRPSREAFVYGLLEV